MENVDLKKRNFTFQTKRKRIDCFAIFFFILKNAITYESSIDDESSLPYN